AASVGAILPYVLSTSCTGWATWSLYVRVFSAIWRHFSLDMLQICGVIHLTYDPLLIRDHGQEDQSLRLEDRGTTSPELFQPPSRSRYRSSLRRLRLLRRPRPRPSQVRDVAPCARGGA